MLKNRRDFSRVGRFGKQVSSTHFFLKTAPSQAETRVGIVISKRISKRAVVRNRLRRRIKGVLLELTLRPGTDAVLYIKSSFERITPVELITEIKGLFHRAGLL